MVLSEREGIVLRHKFHLAAVLLLSTWNGRFKNRCRDIIVNEIVSASRLTARVYIVHHIAYENLLTLNFPNVLPTIHQQTQEGGF